LLWWYSVPFQFFLHVGKAIFSATALPTRKSRCAPGARASFHGAILSDYLKIGKSFCMAHSLLKKLGKHSACQCGSSPCYMIRLGIPITGGHILFESWMQRHRCAFSQGHGSSTVLRRRKPITIRIKMLFAHRYALHCCPI
jgi:hypothetical protein